MRQEVVAHEEAHEHEVVNDGLDVEGEGQRGRHGLQWPAGGEPSGVTDGV